MKAIRIMTTLALFTFLTACAEDSSSSNKNTSVSKVGEFCSSTFISDYNSIIHEAKMYEYDNSEKQISVIKAACEKFYKTHGTDTTCTAGIDYVDKKASARDLYKVCQAVGTKLVN